MAKNPQIIQRIREVRNCLIDKMDRRDIIVKYSKIWDVGFKAIDGYISSARKEIIKDAKQLEDIEQRKLEELGTSQAFHKITLQEKFDVLAKIIKGELEIPVKKPVWDRVQSKYVLVPMQELPDHATRMKAIEIDNKMAGDNAPSTLSVDLNNPDESGLIQRFVILSNGEKIPL